MVQNCLYASSLELTKTPFLSDQPPVREGENPRHRLTCSPADSNRREDKIQFDGQPEPRRSNSQAVMLMSTFAYISNGGISDRDPNGVDASSCELVDVVLRKPS